VKEVREGTEREAASFEVKVTFLGDMRSVVGRREVRVVLGRGARLEDLLQALIREHGEGLRHRIFNPRGELLRHTVVFIDGRDARERGGLEAVLEGEEIDILIMPIFEGG
jgi:ThiS family